MKFNTLILGVFSLALLSCGEETSENNESNESGVETNSFSTAFGECTPTNSIIEKVGEIDEASSFAFEPIANVPFYDFKDCNGELTKNHKVVRIKFVNNSAILNKSSQDYSGDDMSITINIKGDEELKAGEFSDDDLKITLTTVKKVDGTIKSQTVGSNKTPSSVIINELSEEHICGKYSISSAEGTVIVQSAFNLDLSVVSF